MDSQTNAHVPTVAEELELVCFTLIIDDVVFPDGSTRMQLLGGGGPQSLWGYQLARQQRAKVGLAAGVGADLPISCEEWLRGIGCDTSGLIASDVLPTPRAWQVLEDDGRRTQVWRSRECPELYQQLRPKFQQLPPSFQIARNYHIGIHASHPPMTLLRQLRDAAHSRGGLLSVEPYTSCTEPPQEEQLRALLQLCDVFSPNEAEAVSIVGDAAGGSADNGGCTDEGAEELVMRLMQAGARTVALRRGPKGALVCSRGGRHAGSGDCSIGGAGDMEVWHVPAVPELRVVDVTGCGNAFCGAFLAGRTQGLSLAESAAWGCAAGSLMAEWQGVPALDEAAPGSSRMQTAARSRAEALLQRARRVGTVQVAASVAATSKRVCVHRLTSHRTLRSYLAATARL